LRNWGTFKVELVRSTRAGSNTMRAVVIWCLAVLATLVGPALGRDADGQPRRYFLASYASEASIRDIKTAVESSGAKVVGLSPEKRLIVLASEAQMGLLRGVLVSADPVSTGGEAIELQDRGRGLGARRLTREEWEAAKAAFVSIERVEPNELAQLRELLDGAATVDNSASQFFPPIRSQGSQGSCAAWAAGYYYNTYVQAKDGGWNVSSGDNAHICSPAFLYPLENDGEDAGAYTHSVVQRLNEAGCASWAIMPYSAADWTTWPDETQWVEAMPRRTLSAYRLGDPVYNGCSSSDFAAIKQLLANGEILVSDTDVHSTWYDYYPRKTNGIDNAVLFAADGAYEGGHAMTIVGYDDTRTYFDGASTQTGAFLVANSWGTWWGASNTVGQRGYMWVAYSLFTNYNGYFGVAYYNSDRTNYVPRLYAVSGLNHAKRSYVRYRGGIGPTNTPAWISYSVISNDGGSTLAITNNRRVAVDLTDGIGYITNLNNVRLFSEMRVQVGAGSSGALASADFYHDLDGDGCWQAVSATNVPMTVNQNSTRYAVVAFNAAPDTNLFVSITNPPVNITVPYTTSAWTVQGVCGASAAGHIVWSNLLTGQTGYGGSAANWSLENVPLEVGTNALAVMASNSPAAPLMAWDFPTNSYYADGWHTNDNGGSGFGVWSLAAGANAGHFIANASANTNLNIAAAAWGLWANNGDTASGYAISCAAAQAGGAVSGKIRKSLDRNRQVGWCGLAKYTWGIFIGIPFCRRRHELCGQ
jgi:C1A family cysteine protease